MSGFKRFRAAALSVVLAATPVLPGLAAPEAVLTEAQTVESTIARLEARPAASTAAFDISVVNEALRDFARISYASAGTDSVTGAARLTDVRFEFLGDKPLTLFTASELLVWNADAAALSARMSGQRLGETIRLFDRIELSGVVFDLTEYSNMVDDAVTSAMPDVGAPPPAMTYEAADMKVGRIIFSGFTLHPWTYEPSADEEEGLAALRLLSAVARSFSFDNAAMLDTVMSQTMIEGGETGTMVSAYAAQIAEGYHRGDLTSSVQTGATFSGSLPVPAFEDDGVTPAGSTLLEMSGNADYGAWHGLKFSKLFEYGERGQLPPISERDLWSFGIYTIAGMDFDFGGRKIMEIGRIDIAADQFAWFLPERILLKHEDVSFDMMEIMNWAATIEPETAAGSEDEPSIAEIVGILERTGLGKLSGDGTLLLTWDSATGKTLIEGNSVSDGLYADDTRFELTLPAFTDLVPAFGVDGLSPNNELLGEIFDAKFGFTGGHYSLTDSGFLEALAKLTIEVAKISGDSDPMLANFADSTPDNVRMFVSGMLMFGGGAVSKEVPQANGWISSLSAFITSGGTFTIRMAPERPLTSADFAPDPDAGMVEAPRPAELVDLFGLTMTHTPATEAAAERP